MSLKELKTMPKFVKIGPTKIPIEVGMDPDRFPTHWGTFEMRLMRINIHPLIPSKGLLLEVLMHELVHAILELNQVWIASEPPPSKERVAQTMGRDLTSIMLENPGLMKWINSIK